MDHRCHNLLLQVFNQSRDAHTAQRHVAVLGKKVTVSKTET